MAIPQTKEELSQLISFMKSQDASKQAMRNVVDDYRNRTSPLVSSVRRITQQVIPKIAETQSKVAQLSPEQQEVFQVFKERDISEDQAVTVAKADLTDFERERFSIALFKGESFDEALSIAKEEPSFTEKAAHGLIEGGKEFLGGVRHIGEAITGYKAEGEGLLPRGEIEKLTPEERGVKAGKGLIETAAGTAGTVFAVPGAAISEVPIAGELLEEGLRFYEEKVLQSLANLGMDKLGIDPASEQGQVFSEGIKLLGTLGLIKVAPKVIKPIAKKVKPAAEAVVKFTVEQIPKATSQLIKGFQTLKIKLTPDKISKRSKALEEVINQNKSLRNYIEKQRVKGIDVKENVVETNLLVNSVDSNGVIRTKLEGGAVDRYRDFMKPQEKIVSQVLDAEGIRLTLKDVETQITQSVMESGLEGKALTKALSDIKGEIQGYQLRAAKDGTIPLSLINDAKINKYAGINYLSDTAVIDKVMARSLKEIVERNTKSADIKTLNKELAKHYATIEFLSKLDGVRVKGGRLGKYFSGTIGAAIGSMVGGPIGAAVGVEAGFLLKGRSMKKTFGKEGKAIEDVQKVQLPSSSISLKPNQQIPTSSPIQKSSIKGSIKETTEKSIGDLETVSVNDFKKSLNDFYKKRPEFKLFITPRSSTELKGASNFLTKDGRSGFAIMPNGELVSVFSIIKGRGDVLVQEAISKGAKKLDAYDGFLVELYSRNGFKEVKRLKWSDKLAPKGWDKERFGTPDIVFMELK